MKVKELQAKLQYEHPDADVTPCVDADGNPMVLVTAPSVTDGAIDSYPEVVRILGNHVKRIERIRLAIAAFYALPVSFKITTVPNQRDSVEFIVKSSTGEVMVKADLGIEYSLSVDPRAGLKRQQLIPEYSGVVRFTEFDPEMSGYYFWPNKYVLSKDRLHDAVKSLCEAPKMESERNAVVANLQ